MSAKSPMYSFDPSGFVWPPDERAPFAGRAGTPDHLPKGVPLLIMRHDESTLRWVAPVYNRRIRPSPSISCFRWRSRAL